jgi:hypothetical protein
LRSFDCGWEADDRDASAAFDHVTTRAEQDHFVNDFIDNEIILIFDCSMNENHWINRWFRDQIRAMLLEQFQAFWRRDIGIERAQLAELERAAPLPHAVIISGATPCRHNRCACTIALRRAQSHIRGTNRRI